MSSISDILWIHFRACSFADLHCLTVYVFGTNFLSHVICPWLEAIIHWDKRYTTYLRDIIRPTSSRWCQHWSLFYLIEIIRMYQESFYPDNQYFDCKMAIIFFSISWNMYVRCSKEPSHLDGSFEYLQHMFWLRNDKTTFKHALLLEPGIR